MSVTTTLAQRRVLRALGAAGLAATLLLTACAESAPFSYYTLTGPVSTASVQAATARAPRLIEVLPSSVPQQVQRPQLVLTTGAGQIKILEQQRWSQPVADEISQALSQDLTRSLPAIDVYRSAHADTQTVYRIALNVQRFESVPGSRATLDAVWSVTLNPRGLTMTCHSTVNQAVAAAGLADAGSDYAALIAAHQQAIQQLSTQIAAAIDKLGALPASGKAAGTAAAASPSPYLACPVAS